MSVNYAMEDDDSGIDINNPVVLDDLSDQETSDVMERAVKVPWIIKDAKIRTRYDNEGDKSAFVKRLSLQVAVGPDGTDQAGLNSNRRVFMDYILAFTSESGTRDSDWWTKRARGPAKELFTALGFDLKNMPPIDAEFLDGLKEREFTADLLKREQEEKTSEVNDKGKVVYRKTGLFRNELANHRASA